MDDSTQSKLCSDTSHPPSVITPLTLFIKLPTWPLGNLNHSPPPSQPRWVLRRKLFGGGFVKFLWAAFFRVSWYGNKKHMLTYQFVWVSSLKFVYSSFASRCSTICYAYLPEWWRGLAVTSVHDNDIYSASSHFLLLLLLSGRCRRHLAARGPGPPSTRHKWVNWIVLRT